MSNRPPPGTMVWWRPKNKISWHFGYCTYISGHDLIRLGAYNGDTMGGSVVSVNDIEWREYYR